jgi:hypothetical protein
MTENQVNQTPDNKPSDKELNFRQLEAKYERQLQQERSAREEAERKTQELQNRRIPNDEDDTDDEPYVDHKKLNKKLQKFGETTKQQTQTEVRQAVQQALAEERKQNWLRQNPDFYDTLQYAEKFAMKDPELAETILQMPEGFERQKLVYRNIKAMGIDKPEAKQPSIQDKIDANKRSPYYQPSGVGTAPYASSGNFSDQGKREAYEKMQALKNQLRI